MSIYRTGHSPYWRSRIYDPVKKKYVVRSTKETTRIEAIEVAEETLETYKSKRNSSHATSKDRSFEYYAKLLADFNVQKSKSPRNKYTERDRLSASTKYGVEFYQKLKACNLGYNSPKDYIFYPR